MGQPWPGLLRIGRHQLTQLEAILVAQSPDESCALLLGAGRAPAGARTPREALRIEAIWPCLNIWCPVAERGRRFAVDPREQLLAQKWGRRYGWQLIGTAHSHPRGEAVPSRLDRTLAFPPLLMLIASGLAPGPGAVPDPTMPTTIPTTIRAWWISEPTDTASGLAEARPLPLEIEGLGE